ncbi:hypothetical protein G4B11_007749 [Aspergillus flavus]|nr:hypothetical protein G4B11_007749 [Aspergillus flavus]
MAVTTRSELEHQAGNLDDTGLRLVGDYAIHRSPTEQPETQSPVQMTTVVGDVRREAQPSDFNPTLAPHPPVPCAISNPEWWQQEYRRVPDYRPVNRDLDSEQRRQNRLFTAVGTSMIAGSQSPCTLEDLATGGSWMTAWKTTGVLGKQAIIQLLTNIVMSDHGRGSATYADIDRNYCKAVLKELLSATEQENLNPLVPELKACGSHQLSILSALMMSIDPFKVKDVLESTENHRLIQPDWTSEESGQVLGSGTTYRIPANVKAELTGVKTYYHDLQIETGTSLASKLSVSASMGVSYMGVSVNASAEYDMEQQVYSASLRPGAHTWNNIDPNLISRIECLPAWDEKDPAVRQDWRKFFDVYGTHIIIETFFGNSYKMRVTSTETSSMQRERWKACIEAEFLGIVKSTVEAATEEEKKTYKKSRERSVSMEGGALQQSSRLVEDPANQAKYEEWTDTLIPGVNDNITNIKVKSLYNLLEESDHDSHRAAAARIKDALKYFLSLLYVEWEFKCGYGSSETPIPAFDKAAVSFMLGSDDIGTRIIRPNSEYQMKFWYDNPDKPRTMHMEQTQSPGGLGSFHALFFVETPRRPSKVMVHVNRFYKEPAGYWARLRSKLTNTKFTLYSQDAVFWIPELQSIKQPGNWRSGVRVGTVWI